MSSLVYNEDGLLRKVFLHSLHSHGFLSEYTLFCVKRSALRTFSHIYYNQKVVSKSECSGAECDLHFDFWISQLGCICMLSFWNEFSHAQKRAVFPHIHYIHQEPFKKQLFFATVISELVLKLFPCGHIQGVFLEGTIFMPRLNVFPNTLALSVIRVLLLKNNIYLKCLLWISLSFSKASSTSRKEYN